MHLHTPAAALQDARQATRRSTKPLKALPFNVYVARFLGRMKRVARFVKPNLVIVYSSVTGNTRAYAYRLASLLAPAFTVTMMTAAAFETKPLVDAEAVVQMTSTWGAGAPPPSARPWLSYLATAEAREVRPPRLLALLCWCCARWRRRCGGAAGGGFATRRRLRVRDGGVGSAERAEAAGGSQGGRASRAPCAATRQAVHAELMRRAAGAEGVEHAGLER